MTWNPDLLLEDFRRVAGMAGVSLAPDAIAIERRSAPHVPPKSLPLGKMAVYVFSFGQHVLKVGKVGPNSAARYTATSPPVLSSAAIWSPIPNNKEIGREEAFYRRTDHRLPA